MPRRAAPHCGVLSCRPCLNVYSISTWVRVMRAGELGGKSGQISGVRLSTAVVDRNTRWLPILPFCHWALCTAVLSAAHWCNRNDTMKYAGATLRRQTIFRDTKHCLEAEAGGCRGKTLCLSINQQTIKYAYSRSERLAIFTIFIANWFLVWKPIYIQFYAVDIRNYNFHWCCWKFEI